MITSSPVTPGSPGFINEPPLSPGAAPITPTPAPVSQLPSRPSTPSIEAQVVRLGLMTPDQVATAMREEAETGRTFDEIVVGHGWLSAEDLARVREPDAPAPVAPVAPAPAPEPAPPVAAAPSPAVAVVPEPEPEPIAAVEAVEAVVAPEPAPAEPEAAASAQPASVATAHVFVRLASGERIDAGSFDGEGEAERRARELMRLLDAGGDWPQLDGRYIRPDAIVSIDVEASA
jgi:hypothetical protein